MRLRHEDVRLRTGATRPRARWVCRTSPRGADYFGAGSFATITGFSAVIAMFGMMVGPLVAGILADRTGSYAWGFCALAAMAAIGSIFFVLARRPAPPPRPRTP